MSTVNRLMITGFAFAVLVAAAPQAEAGRSLLADVPNSPDGFYYNGQAWNSNNSIADGEDHVTGTLPFAINFGAGAFQYSFSQSLNGFITFGQGESGALPPSGNFIAPFAAALQTLLSTDPNYDERFTYVGWSSGFVANDFQTNFGPYGELGVGPTPDNSVSAIRFSWSNVCLASDVTCSNPYSLQAVLLDRSNGTGNGDFELDFNYGGTMPAGGEQGFTLGSNLLALHGGRIGSPGPDYCFIGGVGGLCGAVAAPVPEPATVSLFVGGLALLGGNAWRRRAAAKTALSAAA